jgi:hypothetical protein
MDTKPNFPTPLLKPALASIPNSCKYMGDVSRAKFYADILPLLETVHFGKRHLVVVASMDRLIAAKRTTTAEPRIVICDSSSSAETKSAEPSLPAECPTLTREPGQTRRSSRRTNP